MCWKMLGRGHQTLLVCTREQAMTSMFCIIYSSIFMFCVFLQRLPGPKTPLLPANTHETQPVTSCPFHQLVCRWVSMTICYLSSLWPRNNSDLKCPSSAEESLGFTPALLPLPYRICFSIFDALSCTHTTLVSHTE